MTKTILSYFSVRRNADSGNIVIFDTSDIKVKLNDAVQLDCGVKQGTTDPSCTWEYGRGDLVEVRQ